MKWTDYERNELYKVTQGAHFMPNYFEYMYKRGDFDSWKGTRKWLSLYQIARRQEVGECMEGVVIQPGVQSQPRIVVQAHKAKTPTPKTQKRDYSQDTRPNHKAMTPAQKQQKAQERELNEASTQAQQDDPNILGKRPVNPDWKPVRLLSTGELVDAARAKFRARQASAVQPTEDADYDAAYTSALDMLNSMAAPNAAPSDEASEDGLSMETQDGSLDNPSMSPNSALLVARLAAFATARGASDDESSMAWTSSTGRRGGGRSGGSAGADELNLWGDDNDDFMHNTGMSMQNPVMAPKRRRIGEVSNDNLEEISSVEFDASVFLHNTSETPTSTPLMMPSVIPTADVHAEVLLFEPLTPAALVASAGMLSSRLFSLSILKAMSCNSIRRWDNSRKLREPVDMQMD